MDVRRKYLFETGHRVEIDDPGYDMEEAKAKISEEIDEFLTDELPEDQEDSETNLVTYVAPFVYPTFRKELKELLDRLKKRAEVALSTKNYSNIGVTEEYLTWLEEMAEKWLNSQS